MCREGDARASIDAWFVREVLPLEAALKQYLRRNWQTRPDVADLLQETYMRLDEVAGRQVPKSAGATRAIAFATAHNLIVDRLRREKIIPGRECSTIIHRVHRLRGYTNVNLTLIFTNQNGWQVMLYDKNVFNMTAITGDFLNSDDFWLTTNVFLTDPRLIGIRVTKTGKANR